MKVIVAISAVFLAAGLLAPCLNAQSLARVEAERLFVEAQKALAVGDDVKAEDYLMKALKSDESFTSAIWQLSQIYEKRGKLEYARELLIRGLQQEPGATWARDKLARMEKTLTGRLLEEAESLMARGKYDLAIPKLSLCLGIKPYDPVPLVMIARCHLAMDNLESAKEYLVQAAERDPTNTEVVQLLDEIERRFDQAEIQRALGRARSVLASYTSETRSQAEKALSDVLKLDPENVWAREKLREIAMLEDERERVPSASEAVSRGVEKVDEAMKTLEEPTSRAISVLRSNILIVLLVIIAALLALNLRRRSSSRSYALQGSLSLIPILDIVSLLNSNLKSGRLMIVSQAGRGEIFFEKGKIIHARLKNWDGRTAFHKLMALRSGRYIFSNHLPSVRHTITEPLSLLLLSMRTRESDRPKGPAKKTAPRREEIFNR